MKGVQFLVAFVLLALASKHVSASDPGPLQDFCVAINDTKDGVFVNGKFCKDPKLATAEDFFLPGLNIPGNTSNQPMFNKYGGLNPPHTHPRATEILVVVEGTLSVGFVTSNMDNRLFTEVLYPGDVFVFPEGSTNAVAFAALSSQNPRVITIANAVFGSDPAINPDVLAKAFQLDQNIVKQLQSRFWWGNN
ncbi:hypothetical protein PVK06_040735 [Gossypium arboreum]|uniref:Germin-like protein n=1 Tax=Gossypium arboreum TaxID=29729 RepID=A0ABR0N6B8_GOSAR|nr:hypothetical protein PVK06_040735 [Gossypium arboreum]